MSEDREVMAEIIRRVSEFDSVQYAADQKLIDFLVGNMEYKDIKAMPMSEFMAMARKAVKEKERRLPNRYVSSKKLKENILKATPVRVRRMW